MADGETHAMQGINDAFTRRPNILELGALILPTSEWLYNMFLMSTTLSVYGCLVGEALGELASSQTYGLAGLPDSISQTSGCFCWVYAQGGFKFASRITGVSPLSPDVPCWACLVWNSLPAINLLEMFPVSVGFSAFLAALSAVKAESHTVTFNNQCGYGTPTLIINGQIVSTGPPYTANEPINGISYLQTGPCGFNGENCPLVEINLADPTAPGAGSVVDISLISPHAYTVETSFAFYNGCDGVGHDCNSSSCYYAFRTPTDYWAQAYCETDEVDLVIEFCGDATNSSTGSGSGSGSYTQTSDPNGDTSKCLDVQSANFANGTPVQIYDCNGTGAQNWVINSGSTAVQVAGQNFCLDAGDSPADGTSMKIWECYSGLAAQTWYYTSDDRIALENQGFCLDLTNGDDADGTVMQIWECTDDDTNQVWTL
ncbi:hypothetical protein NM688_g4073 [Phlebia brevispora]|uniref:Uncharacterized protein n=1 Tax=Phlebia brevispora TaxID=194682 RepID=A0ACC1T461_9APHY|nr:hypothetical protein NM688_g4073 [Phlebia brevispora]